MNYTKVKTKVGDIKTKPKVTVVKTKEGILTVETKSKEWKPNSKTTKE
jgi:hypothetical protein